MNIKLNIDSINGSCYSVEYQLDNHLNERGMNMKKQMIDRIVKATGVTDGELILIHFWGEDNEIEIMHQFAEAVVAQGATPIELQQSRTHNYHMFSVAKESCFDEKYMSLFEKIDAVVDVFTYQPVVLGESLAEKQMEMYRSYMGRLFQQLMSKKRFVQVRVPTAENAKEAALEPEEYITRMEEAYDIDYEGLKEVCAEKIEKLQQAEHIFVETGKDCCLKFTVKERSWMADCGDGDLPCGEVYIAPQENATEGNIFFEKLYIEELGKFEKVMFTVKAGKLICATDVKVQSFLDGLTEQQKTVCELGFGCNPNIKSLCGYIVLDEKMAETVHFAIGNNVMFGGKNEAEVHMDFVNEHASYRMG